MLLEAKKCLFDIQRAVNLIAQFTASKNFSDYQSEPMLRFAVERGLTIVGEALSKLSKLEPSLATRIGEHHSIIAFRNILIHAYADVDDRIVWDIVETEVPALGRQVADLMHEDEGQRG
jgi:uncharacterized protein with HEPN domain